MHAILEGGPMVASTVQRTGEAARAVDDLAETLAIFDLKLRHMREAGLFVLLLPKELAISRSDMSICPTSACKASTAKLGENACLQDRTGTPCDPLQQSQQLPYQRPEDSGTLQDIAAIEARNNRLERQARHNAALMDSLERLLERLVLPEQTERILNTSTFNYGMCVTSHHAFTPEHSEEMKLPSFLLSCAVLPNSSC